LLQQSGDPQRVIKVKQNVYNNSRNIVVVIVIVVVVVIITTTTTTTTVDQKEGNIHQ
jgi:hypothetical protein